MILSMKRGKSGNQLNTLGRNMMLGT
uniref:Uncharacterized protein n=1 Tax=Rhizophora mucronata TaxID=61149 RepID=A0A2P2NHH9_RHIMU